jgi:hypothetical protein
MAVGAGMAPPQPGMAPPQPGMAPPQPGMAPPQPGMAPPQPGMTPAAEAGKESVTEVTLTVPFEEKIPKMQGLFALLGINMLFVIVPAIKLWIMSIIASIKMFIAFIKLLIGGGKYPKDLWEYQRKFLQQSMRVTSYCFALTSKKPAGPDDKHPVNLQIPMAKKIGFVQLLFGSLIMIPQMFLGYLWGIKVAITAVLGLIGVFTGGAWNKSKFTTITVYMQHMLSVVAYATWMTDVKPPLLPPGAKVKVRLDNDGLGDD